MVFFVSLFQRNTQQEYVEVFVVVGTVYVLPEGLGGLWTVEESATVGVAPLHFMIPAN
jgi:uncharacterized cupin superfamily protein